MAETEKYKLIDKEHIERMYNTMISLHDDIKTMRKAQRKIVNVLSQTMENQNEIIPWLQNLEERFAVVMDFLSGEIEAGDLQDILEELAGEEDEDEDGEEG